MAEVGVVWLGGDATPPDPGLQQLTWLWEVQSTKPCAACQAMDGHIVESILFVKHQGCACSLTPVMYNWFKGRFEVGETQSWLLEEIGIVPGHGSKTFIQSMTPSGNLSFGPAGVGFGMSFGENTTLNNGESEDVVAYAVYQVTETEYCDLWHRDTPATGHEDFHNAVFRIVTEFHTLTTNPSQYQ